MQRIAFPTRCPTASTLRPPASRRHAVSRRGAVQARAEWRSDTGKPATSLMDRATQAADLFFKRYDVLSCGVGALAVTTIFVARGQDPLTAAGITVGSTIVALVSPRAAPLLG